jgi:glutamate-1-semialdehyde 2,1-aminomutase
MNHSTQLFEQAQKHIPGGVNSPVRAFQAVGGNPKFIARAKGAFVWDVDGKKYTDFVGSWGPLILGHADPDVIRAITKQAKFGTSYGAPTHNEIKLAELIKSAFPSIEEVRLVSSGTEATMSAIRLARGVTGRRKIVKCDGGYHGHVDSLLVQAGSGAATFGIPDSSGVPEELARLTVSIPYNDLNALERTLKQHRDDVACFIVEPIPANMGVVLPRPGYLEGVRQLTKKYGVQLIFDEVISGFRVAFGGAQEYFGVKADITCLGKVLGGGLPIGAFGASKKIMSHLAPLGKVYQAGTLSGNPIATAAGITTLTKLKKKNFYKALDQKTEKLISFLTDHIEKHALPVTLNHMGSAFTIFFTEVPVTDYQSAKSSSTKRYGQYFRSLLDKGIYLAPSQFEANFVSAAHQEADLSRVAHTIVKVLSS